MAKQKIPSWEVYTISEGHYSKAIYHNNELVLKGGFFVAGRLYNRITGRPLHMISLTRKDYNY